MFYQFNAKSIQFDEMEQNSLELFCTRIKNRQYVFKYNLSFSKQSIKWKQPAWKAVGLCVSGDSRCLLNCVREGRIIRNQEVVASIPGVPLSFSDFMQFVHTYAIKQRNVLLVKGWRCSVDVNVTASLEETCDRLPPGLRFSYLSAGPASSISYEEREFYLIS